MIYKRILRPLLFSFDAEAVHHFTLSMLRHTPLASMIALGHPPPQDPVELWGLRFPNRIGAAAGLDKNALAVPAWQKLGFGFIEVGGVTPKPQKGNPRPRIFRCLKEEGIINCMNFPNHGVEAMAGRLKAYREQTANKHFDFPIGINMSKGSDTPVEGAADDYLLLLEKLFPYSDFFVVDISCPNTPGMCDLQTKDKEFTSHILNVVQTFNRQQPKRKPILTKLSPDLAPHQLEQMLEIVLAYELDGVIATNTTTDHSAVSLKQKGGLSGKPLRAKSTEMIRAIYRQTQGKLPIIGVGGIFSRDDYLEKLDTGATLVQLYTGLVYEGPRIVHRLLKA